MQSVLKKWAFSAGALALSVGLSACGKVKDMPNSGKQSQTEAPVAATIPSSFQGIWSHYGYSGTGDGQDTVQVLVPRDGGSHLKLAADGTLYQLSKYEVIGVGPHPRKVSMQYEVAGKVAMVTPHSAGLIPRGVFLDTLLAIGDYFGLSAPSFEMVRYTAGEKPELCILAWDGDRGGFLGGSPDGSFESQCYQRFSLGQMEDYLRDKAKQGSGQ